MFTLVKFVLLLTSVSWNNQHVCVFHTKICRAKPFNVVLYTTHSISKTYCHGNSIKHVNKMPNSKICAM